MFNSILLAMDGSPHAEEALKYARDLALRDGAQVIVVHACEQGASRCRTAPGGKRRGEGTTGCRPGSRR